ERIIERFFRPFLGGVFLDRELQTSSRFCEFVFRMFSLGDAAVPRLGMEQIPQQLAAGLPPQQVRCNARVQQVTDQAVTLEQGEVLSASAVVVATDALTADRLLSGQPASPPSGAVEPQAESACRGVQCVYFAAARSPIDEAILVLNGEAEGPVNNLCVASDVAKDYAPPGQALISATVLGVAADPTALVAEVREQLQSWFGPAVKQWQHLKTYSIPYALPNQQPPALDPVAKPSDVREGVFVCGDHCDTGSINGAMASGRRAAEAVAAQLSN
ncbi:MAG: FAD-dependent oxidoreductase, partial [Planctomycetota bacterium]